ncbi:MAG TPA: hypothetical protein VHE37_10705, partial [Nevskiaceae bacterium]|nr:hypothetical protein [Nevskiaceae bacterium]
MALGLGEIDVKSKLNQKFSAVIPLSSISADDAETAIVGLASNEEFARAGLERGDYLSSLVFSVRTDGQPRIVVSSAQITREPYLAFLIEVRTRNSRVLREYSVLLDPADYSLAASKPAASTPAASAPASSQFYQTPEEAAHTAPAAPAAKPAAPASSSSDYVYVPTPPVSPTVAATRGAAEG